jgi:hypothetical protein
MIARTIVTAALLCSGIALAADNPFAGTWKIDTPKSSWSDGKFPKNMSLTITMSSKGDEVTYHSVNDTNKDRPPALVDYTAKMNWKPFPLTGAARYNQAAVRMLSPTQMEVIEMKDANVIVHAIYDLMPGGKRFARRGMAISVDGSSHEYEEFFDRQ